MDRFAAIADIHGNRWALEATLEDIAGRGIQEIVNAGDHLFGPLDPAGTADLLMGLGWPGVAGNQDRELIDGSAASPGGTLELNRKSLSPAHLAWIAALPFAMELRDGIRMFHGTPERDDVYLLESVRADGSVTAAAEAEIRERLAGASDALLICGHTHIPRVARCGAVQIVNPGSVGLQAYADDSPAPHVMETGSPEARYAVLERGDEGWRVAEILVRYDVEAAARAAERNGRPDWAFRIRTGRATKA